MDATGTKARKLAAVLLGRIATGRRSTRQAMFPTAGATAGRAGDAGAVDVRDGDDEHAVVRGGHAGLAGRPGSMFLGSLAVG
jgi:hypothetical protein